MRDLREVYWIVDPIETRVVIEDPMRKMPLPGTTGEIEPEEHDIMDIPEVRYALLTGDVSQLLKIANREEGRGE